MKNIDAIDFLLFCIINSQFDVEYSFLSFLDAFLAEMILIVASLSV
ncbi:hypothetical protein [Cyanobacterium aponinum]|nr:hypothetical protein [Cyanobacterium aponinum]